MDEEVTVVVIDNGSGECKAGFAGNDAPRTVFSSIVGRPKVPQIMVGLDNNDVYMGSQAEEKRGVLKMTRPIQEGDVIDWDDMEKLWYYTLQIELKVSPEHHPLLLTESPLTSRESREKTTQIMFEVFNVPCLYVQSQAVLSLYSGGRTTGVVFDSGYGVSHAIPVFEGYTIPGGATRIKMSGEHCTDELQRLLNERAMAASSMGVRLMDNTMTKTFTTPTEVE